MSIVQVYITKIHFVYFDYKNNYTAPTSLTSAQSDVTFTCVTCVSDKA